MTAATRPAALTWQQLVRLQDGVLARGQALRAGMTEDAWQWSLERRGWRPVLPGVAVEHGGALTERQRAWAAVLYAGEGARLAGEAALVLHGLRLPPLSRLDVAVPEKRSVRPQVLRSAGRFGGGDDVPVRVRSVVRLSALGQPGRLLPVVRPAPAALQAAAWAPTDRAAEWRVAATVQQRLVGVPALRAALAAVPRLPRRRLIAAVLDDVELGAHARGELDFLALLRRHRLPLPDHLQRQVRASGVHYLDAWWQARRVAGEIDGAHHRDVGTWDADVLRANGVQLAERHDRVVLLRFTTGNLRHDEATVARQLRAVLLG